MTTSDQTPPLEPTPRRSVGVGRRFPRTWVHLGVFTGLLTTWAFVTGSGATRAGVFALMLPLVPLLAGVVLLVVRGDARRRGFGVGLVIGWGVLLVLAAGFWLLMDVALSAG